MAEAFWCLRHPHRSLIGSDGAFDGAGENSTMTHESRGAVVVTGASSGFGARTAQVLAEEGHPVVAVARRADRLESLASHDPQLKIWPLVADVRNADALAKAFEELPEEYRNVSALVNNAGLSKGLEPIQSGDRSLWREMVDTNILGLLNVTDLILPRLVARGAGHIVNVGSIAATYPYLGGNVYGATKAFVHQLTLNMCADLHGTGVRVSCVAPGMAKTEFALVRFDGDADRADRLYDGVVPLSADDVAQAVSWCLSRPPHVNVNMIEIMPTDQNLALGFPASGPSR
ncbi:SDR family NAD(P)-dependent oxidoreductase [Streptomyces camelliae]|uniref:SDR family NAD(P)-dependent oxidoreductase n=1 Tax=Streptomyces camelliae TaxID=3004093 RepID=A0ABY7P5X9_9ACTN|nr:SDR family NAD(P)-dependent oxidoreductase [Streptomyces sp. HUAS 2-6]WBO65112.1 SDR family NAD(P)-dependent oxidoreductase [Streptomyces sp. HUAS 2-6]